MPKPLNRNYAATLVLFLVAGSANVTAQSSKPNTLTDIQIMQVIDKYRPTKGAVIPANIKHRLGATHVGGKYFFTSEPYLV